MLGRWRFPLGVWILRYPAQFVNKYFENVLPRTMRRRFRVLEINRLPRNVNNKLQLFRE